MVQLSNRANVKPIAAQVLMVDGLSGSGKTALSPILQGFERVENVQVKYVVDFVCCYRTFNEMSSNAAESALRLLLDQFVYDNSISREVNVRPSDLTSIFKSRLRSRYVDRLFLADGAEALIRIGREKPILHLMGHQLFAVSRPLFALLGSNLTFLEMVRHPLTLLRQWFSYIDRYGTDASDFTVWLQHKGQDVPWFVKGHEDEYLAARRMDKVILSLKCIGQLRASTYRDLSEAQKARFLAIPFERFVRNPDPYLDHISKLLQSSPTEQMTEILKAQRIPRVLSSDGPAGVWEEKYDQVRPQAGATEEDECAKAWEFAKREASNDSLADLRELCRIYEAAY